MKHPALTAAILTPEARALLVAIATEGPLSAADLRAQYGVKGLGDVLDRLRAGGLISTLRGIGDTGNAGDPESWTRITREGRVALAETAPRRNPCSDLGVIRRWMNGDWLYLNRRDKGFAEYAHPYATLEALLAGWSLVVTGIEQDEHGLYLTTAKRVPT